jgi:cytochrome c biogenesis protein CcmG/thiol:disulfide interchange protein DsbE
VSRPLLSPRWLALPVVLVPVAWLLFTGLGRDPHEIPSPLIGHPLPAFTATTLDGTTFSSAKLAGRPAVVNVWASWCAPCIDEHPVLLEAAGGYEEELLMVGIVYQDTADGVRSFLARYGDGGWPNLLDTTGKIAVDLGVTGPPETFFVGADGLVRARHIGPLTADVMAEELAGMGLSP